MNVPTSTRGTVLRAGAWTLFLISVSIAIGYTAWPSDAIAPAAAAPVVATPLPANSIRPLHPWRSCPRHRMVPMARPQPHV